MRGKHSATTPIKHKWLSQCPPAALTVSVAVPLFPETVAVIVAFAAVVPLLVPVARPFASTVATELSELCQVAAGAPVTGLPCASLALAVNCWGLPLRMVAEGGETVTEATALGAT